MTFDYANPPKAAKSSSIVPKQSNERLMQYTEFLQRNPMESWDDYKIYLRSKGALSPALFHTT